MFFVVRFFLVLLTLFFLLKLFSSHIYCIPKHRGNQYRKEIFSVMYLVQFRDFLLTFVFLIFILDI